MKTIEIPENGHMNKTLIAEGDERAVDLFRREVANRGGTVNGNLALGIRKPGYLVVYDPAPSMCAPGVFRFNFRSMTDKDTQFQNRLKSLRKKRGGIKIRRWSHEKNCMVTEEDNLGIAAQAIGVHGSHTDPATGLPIIG